MTLRNLVVNVPAAMAEHLVAEWSPLLAGDEGRVFEYQRRGAARVVSVTGEFAGASLGWQQSDNAQVWATVGTFTGTGALELQQLARYVRPVVTGGTAATRLRVRLTQEQSLTARAFGRGDARRVASRLRLASSAGRPPCTEDDATRGHRVGDLWLSPEGQPIRIARAVGAGAARWSSLGYAGALPLDLVRSGAPVAAYGTVKLRAAYAGHCLQVKRVSDNTTLNIGFVRTIRNGRVVEVLDVGALQAFIAGTTGRVSIWYDQSGGTNNAIEVTPNNNPAIGVNWIGGLPAVTFDSNLVGTGSPDPLVARYLGCATGSIPYRNCSLFVAGRSRSTLTQSVAMQINGTSRFWMAAGSNLVGMGISLNLPGIAAPVTPSVFGWRTNGSPIELRVWSDNRTAVGPLTGGAFTATGFLCGGDGTSNTYASSDMTAWICYGRTVTDQEALDLRASLAELTGTPPQRADAVVVADGDSITYGSNSTHLRTRTCFEQELYAPRHVRTHNIAVHGTSVTNRQSVRASIWPLVYDASAPVFVACVNLGTNDISSGASAAATYAGYVDYCRYIRALGPNVRIVAATLLPRGFTAAPEAQRQAFNRMIRDSCAHFADALADHDADPIMGPNAATSDPAWYADGTHPTSAGYELMAQLQAAAVIPLLDAA